MGTDVMYLNGQNDDSRRAGVLNAMRDFMASKIVGRRAKSTAKPNATTANLFATPDSIGQRRDEKPNHQPHPEKINHGANKAFSLFRFRPAPEFLPNRSESEFEAVKSTNTGERASSKGVNAKCC